METVTLNGVDVPLDEIASVTWEGLRTPRGLRLAAILCVTDCAGNQYLIDPVTLPDGDKVLFMDIAFPG